MIAPLPKATPPEHIVRKQGKVSAYRAFEVTGKRQFRPVERQTPVPLPGQVRLRVYACGVPRLGILSPRKDPAPNGEDGGRDELHSCEREHTLAGLN